ncbi:hypothetical protein INR49_023642 [Caranx melampygus]|nr:hypothetical protein INR49_023642 [Caranx melampygus]
MLTPYYWSIYNSTSHCTSTDSDCLGLELDYMTVTELLYSSYLQSQRPHRPRLPGHVISQLVFSTSA